MTCLVCLFHGMTENAFFWGRQFSCQWFCLDENLIWHTINWTAKANLCLENVARLQPIWRSSCQRWGEEHQSEFYSRLLVMLIDNEDWELLQEICDRHMKHQIQILAYIWSRNGNHGCWQRFSRLDWIFERECSFFRDKSPILMWDMMSGTGRRSL